MGGSGSGWERSGRETVRSWCFGGGAGGAAEGGRPGPGATMRGECVEAATWNCFRRDAVIVWRNIEKTHVTGFCVASCRHRGTAVIFPLSQ